jgi:HD-GYP domain-containing protein (c-di-GMP phosphodiesterase class II)
MQPAREQKDIEKPHVLLIGLSPEQRASVAPILKDCVISEQPAQARLLMDNPLPLSSIIICAKPEGQTSYDEMVQLLRMLYQEQPLFFVCDDRVLFNRFRFIRNGATDAFLLPIDLEIFKRGLNDSIERASHGARRSFQPIKLLDIEPGSTLNFDIYIYLPTNSRYIHYLAAHTAFEEKRIKQLHAHDMGTLYVRSQDLQTFYAYANSQSQTLELSRGITERKQILRDKIRDLMTRILFAKDDISKAEGKKFADELNQIVQETILKPDANQWYLPLLNWIGEPYDIYTHLANVALYSTVFATGLGLPNISDVAAAGLLHDIGLALLPAEILAKPVAQLTPTEKKAYEQHPKNSVSILKNRHIDFGYAAERIILQHHETYSGTGYPFGSVASEISWGAQIIGLVNEIDHAIAAKPGSIGRSPISVVKGLIQASANNPGQQSFDPALLKSVLKLFPQEKEKNV